MEKGRTNSGFEFEVDKEVFDDWDLLEKLNAIDKGNDALTVDVAKAVLGEEQLEALKEHVRSDTGKVSIRKMMGELEEILEACGPAKN